MQCPIGLGYLPIIWSLFTFSVPIIWYVISVSTKHVYPILPAVSDTAPEANVFSVLMNTSIFFGIANIFVRYGQCNLQITYCREMKETLLCLNQAGLALGLFGFFGAAMVANFQSKKNHFMLEIHDVGAVLLFIFGGFYFWVQTIISFLMRPYRIYSSCLCYLRLVLTTFASVCSIIFFTAFACGYEVFVKNNHNHNATQWVSEHGGYTLHVLGNVAEWLVFITLVGLSLSFYSEFQCVQISLECREKRPNILSAYDNLGEYSTIALDAEERFVSNYEHMKE